MNVKFTATKDECFVIMQIAQRAAKAAAQAGVEYSVMTAAMDIEAVHCNCHTLRLGDLKIADDFNFAHDVFGIRRHLNRETGKLEDFFVPRFVQPSTTDVTKAGVRSSRFAKRSAA